MNAEKASGGLTPQPTSNFKDTPFAKALPITIGLTLGIGFGPSIYKAIGETTGWGTYALATFCLGTLFMGVVGAFIGGASQVFINSLGKEVKG